MEETRAAAPGRGQNKAAERVQAGKGASGRSAVSGAPDAAAGQLWTVLRGTNSCPAV